MGLRKVGFVVAAVAMVAAGCAEKQVGSPYLTPDATGTGTPSTSSSTRPTGSSGGSAPKINNPLDASRYLGQPCAMLTPSQLQPFNLPAQGKPDTDSETAKTVGPGCDWFNRDTGSGVAVTLLTGNKHGLSDTYQGRAQSKGYFEPIEVDGYPAVFSSNVDDRGDGVCDLVVGISENLAFLSDVQDSQLGPKACDRAKQFASLVLKTMKGA